MQIQQRCRITQYPGELERSTLIGFGLLAEGGMLESQTAPNGIRVMKFLKHCSEDDEEELSEEHIDPVSFATIRGDSIKLQRISDDECHRRRLSISYSLCGCVPV